MAKTTAAQETDGKEWETFVVDTMSQAQAAIDDLFGAQANLFGVHELYDYLKLSDDEDGLITDLKKSIEHAKVIHNTTSPTPEMVFKLFSEIDGETP